MVTNMETLRSHINTILDPEIPVLTLNDLGVIRNLEFKDNAFVVTITPTYSGCPAVDRMKDDLIACAKSEGIENFRVDVSYVPAWTTEWMSDDAQKRLKAYGIAPPNSCCANPSCKSLNSSTVQCPRCDSRNTSLISQFGSTACKSLHKCLDCLEPFEYFKSHH
jgi:ring-1,2-phenylacetyl-CoA epoxidase subunit PaaD